MDELRPLKHACVACGAQATRILTIDVVVDTPLQRVVKAQIPLCGTCIPKGVSQLRMAALPSHLDTTLSRAASFPPGRGEWFRAEGHGGYMLGCPLCGALTSLNPTINGVEDGGKMTPSFICPYGCGFHAWLTLEGA